MHNQRGSGQTLSADSLTKASGSPNTQDRNHPFELASAIFPSLISAPKPSSLLNHTHQHINMCFPYLINKNMDLEDVMLSKISQTERQMLYILTYTWNLRKSNSDVQGTDC